MKLSELAAALVRVSDKAANIARSVRSEQSLFELLVEEKTGEQKNKRFVQDFKTLTDVLVQEIVKHDLGIQFPGVRENIFGEESNHFSNVNGESIIVEVKKTIEETTDLLARVLDGNRAAAGLLAELVHQEYPQSTPAQLHEVDAAVPTTDIGIWIDPIDSTAQYINGTAGHISARGVYEDGLPCVVVLIGAYNRQTGQPICGVANQPFSSYDQEEQRWQGRAVWGLTFNDLNITSAEPVTHTEKNAAGRQCIVMSTSENSELKSVLGKEFELTYASGAGYKILCVIDGVVDAYVLSQGSTFKWDTCGPHSILKCLGGSLVDFKKMCSQGECNDDVITQCDVTYEKPDRDDASPGQRWANSGGIIAFRDKDLLNKITHQLKAAK